MKINLLDKNNNAAILLAGIISIIIGVGVTRFAFTSLLPFMLEDFLNIKKAGILASLNFAGYLFGAVLIVFIKDINAKVKYFRLGIIIIILTTFVLVYSSNYYLWIFARMLAGLGSSYVLIIAGALVMVKLNLKNKTKAMGIHYCGIGIAIVIVEVIAQYTLSFGTWKMAWLILSLFAFVLSFYCIYILSFDKKIKEKAIKHKFDTSIFSLYVILLILSYFTQGIGFVVQATFLPDIVNSLEGLEGYGNLTWLIVGLAGIPSSILWMRLAHKKGSINVIIIAMILQIIGILIPAFSTNLYLILLSAILYGSTFIGLVSLFMTLGGNIAKNNPVVLMSIFTSAYGLGQILGPLYSVYLIQIYSNYNTALYLTAFFVFCGILLLLIAKRIKNKT